MFMHANWMHLGGNMLFLWIFGDNLERSASPPDRAWVGWLGRRRAANGMA
jgi:hypothetical protein